MASRLVIASLALATFGLPIQAFATGSLECVIADDNLDFAFHSLFNYTGAAPLFQLGGEFASKVPSTVASLKKFEIVDTDLKQQWFEGKDLKLKFYKETSGDKEPFGAVELTIETATSDEDETSYAGTYRLEVTPEPKPDVETVPVKLEGKVACSAG